MDDKRHDLYLVAAIIVDIDHKNRQYTVKRINDNQVATYHWHQIVVEYNKEKHSVDLEEHKRKILAERNGEAPPPKKIKRTPPKKGTKRKRGTDQSTDPNIVTIEPNPPSIPMTEPANQPPTKKRKLSDGMIPSVPSIPSDSAHPSHSTHQSSNTESIDSSTEAHQAIASIARTLPDLNDLKQVNTINEATNTTANLSTDSQPLNNSNSSNVSISCNVTTPFNPSMPEQPPLEVVPTVQPYFPIVEYRILFLCDSSLPFD